MSLFDPHFHRVNTDKCVNAFLNIGQTIHIEMRKRISLGSRSKWEAGLEVLQDMLAYIYFLMLLISL